MDSDNHCKNPKCKCGPDCKCEGNCSNASCCKNCNPPLQANESGLTNLVDIAGKAKEEST